MRRVVVSTYQSVSGAGKDAMDELWAQTKGKYVPGQEVQPKKFPKEIAFNLIPHIDVFMEDGYTKEEWKMLAETKKMLDPKIRVTATCVRVPVFVGHSESVNIEFARPISPDEAREILRNAPGISVIDKREPGGYITPVEAAGEFDTFVQEPVFTHHLGDVIADDGGLKQFYHVADVLSQDFNIRFSNKEDDFDAIDWEFRFKGHPLTLHYSIYNGISIFPTRTKDAQTKDNKAVVELANALEGKLFNTGIRSIA